MMEMRAYHIELKGSSYQVGKVLGSMAKEVPGLQEFLILKENAFTSEEEKEVYKLFDAFCPGINEEIAGFSDVLSVRPGQVIYYLMSYLRPGCSQMAVLPSKTQDGHVLLARNYDFSEKMEGMTLATTRIDGKYAHIGSSIMQFGRGDGMNEHGLAVSQTSAGFPVSNLEGGRKPAIVGLQFWAVIRAILENCKNVEEALYLAKQMPIAYNINMIAADKGGNAALLESVDGEKAIRKISADTKEQFISSTNHVHLPELLEYDPKRFKNSVVRYARINNMLNSKELISKEDLKGLLSTRYPEGLCCHYYDAYFGTLRGMVFDVTQGTVEVSFGSPALNEWHSFTMDQEVKQNYYPVVLKKEIPDPDFFEFTL
ncbi:MAG: C45 family peptidase [Clostridia bacterium]|nr:C45 family peptidase [Clostridia bacterium]